MEANIRFRLEGGRILVNTQIAPLYSNSKTHSCTVTRVYLAEGSSKRIANFILSSEDEVAQYLVMLFANANIEYSFPIIEKIWLDNGLDDFYGDNDDGLVYKD